MYVFMCRRGERIYTNQKQSKHQKAKGSVLSIVKEKWIFLGALTLLYFHFVARSLAPSLPPKYFY